ncbi:hypothetical protein ESCO_004900 [Escovopsis weberi]|uniref:F-box domain-containing protein n=1 Tax=Escovopsis weberi TaxID=150374 RepID=A0A0M8MPR1_ESCWE|nr:hypothetical protein ESCO_004900 [Escovopsis weberi]
MRRPSASGAGLRTDSIQRIASDAGTTTSGGGGGAAAAAPKKWRRFKERFGISPSGREEKSPIQRQTSIAEAEPQDYPSSEKGSSIQGSPESASRQLQNLVARMRSLPSGPNHLDIAYKEFFKIREQCAGLCRSILQDGMISPRTDPSNPTDSPRMNRSPSLDAPQSPPGASHFDQRSSFSGRSLAEVMSGNRAGGGTGDSWLNPVRDWKTCLETLTHAFETHLVEVYKSYERDATAEMIEALFLSKRFRKDAINRMRNASVTKIMSADPQFFPHYEIRFRFCEKVKQELMDIRRLLQAGESGISPHRLIWEFPIAPRGDAMLEFANLSPEAMGSEPVLRFRVSSSLLAETSPIFAIMFGGRPDSHYVHEMEGIASQLPPPAVSYFCEDGSEVKLYRMPQLEVNKLESLEILLHAAHHHSEKLERDVSFEQFVAIAHCCMRYKCTAPLEMIVEHTWLPQWMHKGAEDRPDDLLIISYAFGLRQLFARMSKVAVLNVVDERDLQSKPWPRKIREKIWAVRNAKLDQLHACCASALQEYLRQPAREPPLTGSHPASLNEFDRRLSSPVQPTMTISSTPRCPRGSHGCDASNLGWLMLVYNELGLLPHVMKPTVPSLQPSQARLPSPSRSLAQMIELLRSIPSASAPVHPGSLCDPALPFRAAIADVYGSMTGLTLFDISGKSHGWALSKNKMSEPQVFHAFGLDRMASHDVAHSVVSEFPEEVRLRILGEIRDLKDLQRAARISRAFYYTYKRNEVRLMKNLLVAGRSRADAPPSPFEDAGPDEGKVLKSEADQLKERGFGQGADIITLRSEEDEDEVDVSDSDDTESMSDETIHDDLELALVHDPPPPFRPQDADPPPPPPPPPPPSDPSMDEEDASDDEPPMTDEEARRILWPEHLEHHIGSMASSSHALRPVPAEVEGLKEKFRTGDVSFREGLEAKVLLDPGDVHGAVKRVGLTKEELLGQ